MPWLTVVTTILSAVVMPLVMIWVGRKLTHMDRRGESRRQENVLILQGLDVIGGMSCATAKAVRDQHCNGEVTAALERYGKYNAELKGYLYRQASEK